MNETKVTEEYLSLFPTRLHNILKIERNRRKFINNVCDEFDDVVVYRGLHRADLIHEDDFIGNLDEAELYGRSNRKETIEMCAVSVNEDKQQIITALSIPNQNRPALGIAKGLMKAEYGPADFKEVEGVKKTHHNWYLFEDKIKDVVMEFTLVNIDE